MQWETNMSLGYEMKLVRDVFDPSVTLDDSFSNEE